MSRRVLFVSKPIGPPFHDGTKCLVRDVALNLSRYEAQIMVRPDVTSLGYPPREGHRGVRAARVYRDAGSFTPTLGANARAAAFLFLRARADVWHFAFAPNARTSAVGRAARALRRATVVQTVASAPRVFTTELFFGDVVVAQSRWTAERIFRAFESAGKRSPKVHVIPPPVGPLRAPPPHDVERVRRELVLPEGAPVFVYPGDLEVSTGAETVACAVPEIARALETAVVVFACRPKTAAAPAIEEALRGRLDARRVRFVREVSLPALLAAATAVLFPVEDLYGKVDLPISLLEAMRLGVPIVTLDSGPLADLDTAVRIGAGDAAALAGAAVRLATDAAFRQTSIGAGRRAVETRFDARVVAEGYERVYDEVLRGRRARS
jgi:glycosyltransferase involved in cell wall biosynthesis